jgi:uncharacterized protein (TIGR03086 family)
MSNPQRPDLGPAAARLVDLLAGIKDDQLGAPTPCPDYTLGDLLDHVGSLALAFTACARKEVDSPYVTGRPGDAGQLAADWRTSIPHDLTELAKAWRDQAAWDGMTRVGGLDLPGEIAGVIGLDELVVHGWDVARATEQPYDVDIASLEACMVFLSQPVDRTSSALFGPVVAVADDAPLLDRVIGLSGREPAW